MKPRIVITCGDPAGIGPEIVAKALRSPAVRAVCQAIVIGQRDVTIRPGWLSRAAGRIAIDALQEALARLRRGEADALVTAPVSKESFALADLGFPGHTEFLAHEAGLRNAAMLMVAGPLRALLMTRHVPLKDVSKCLSPAQIVRDARLATDFLRRHICPRPRIVLCGINPHAGDNGLIGRDEKRLFGPALRMIRRQRLPVTGPVPADTAFRDMARGRYDLALAAYHDQGMIPLKLFSGQRLVNITLGLPYIRTSPGHGTAFDIAGRNRADPRSMIEAIVLAARYTR